MKILIDARLYGLENAGLGRYSINLVGNLSDIDSKNSYVILLRKKYFDSLELPKNWKKVLADYQHYGFKEQIEIPKIIKQENPDISHFLHFNVPVFGARKYIVTIHDMLMHKNRGMEATTLPIPIYLFKKSIYGIVFKNAVYKAFKVIVPSKAVKKELSDYYCINEKKVEVIYEG